MQTLNTNKIIQIFITNTVQCYFSGYGKYNYLKNIDKINKSIDKLLVNNFPHLQSILPYEDQEKLLKDYNNSLNNLKNSGKKRYVKLGIL